MKFLDRDKTIRFLISVFSSFSRVHCLTLSQSKSSWSTVMFTQLSHTPSTTICWRNLSSYGLGKSFLRLCSSRKIPWFLQFPKFQDRCKTFVHKFSLETIFYNRVVLSCSIVLHVYSTKRTIVSKMHALESFTLYIWNWYIVWCFQILIYYTLPLSRKMFFWLSKLWPYTCICYPVAKCIYVPNHYM